MSIHGLLFTGWLEIMIMCPSGRHVQPRTVVYWLARNHDNVSEWASCLSTDCCFSEVFVVYWLARNHDNVSEWASCLSTDCCFSELALLKN